MGAIRIIHYTIAFALEVALLVALALFGWRIGEAIWIDIATAVGLLAVAIGLWAYFAAPTSRHRLGMPWLAIFKAVMFGAGTLALWLAGEGGWAMGFGLVAAADLGLGAALGAN
jgi:Protein of unknown function (DUF2568)